MSTFYTKGIILRKTDRGEADQVFSIYTQDKGKVLAIGKAVKKIQSKLNPNLQQFAVLELMVAFGKSYDHIAAVKIEKNFSKLKTDLKKIILGSFALELVDKLVKPGQPDTAIFALLEKYFSALDQNIFTEKDWQVIKQAFALKLLIILGLGPTEEVAGNSVKFEKFLNSQLDEELKIQPFLSKI